MQVVLAFTLLRLAALVSAATKIFERITTAILFHCAHILLESESMMEREETEHRHNRKRMATRMLNPDPRTASIRRSTGNPRTPLGKWVAAFMRHPSEMEPGAALSPEELVKVAYPDETSRMVELGLHHVTIQVRERVGWREWFAFFCKPTALPFAESFFHSRMNARQASIVMRWVVDTFGLTRLRERGAHSWTSATFGKELRDGTRLRVGFLSKGLEGDEEEGCSLELSAWVSEDVSEDGLKEAVTLLAKMEAGYVVLDAHTRCRLQLD